MDAAPPRATSSGPGVDDPAPRVTSIPRGTPCFGRCPHDQEAPWAYAALTSCMVHLKAQASAGEKDVVITAANDVPYDAIIHTMDALRSSAGEELFPDVSFGVPR